MISPVAFRPVFTENPTDLSSPIRDKPEWPIQIPESRHLVIRVYKKAHSVVVVRICNAGWSAPLIR
jgi:hypothetical protein